LLTAAKPKKFPERIKVILWYKQNGMIFEIEPVKPYF